MMGMPHGIYAPAHAAEVPALGQTRKPAPLDAETRSLSGSDVPALLAGDLDKGIQDIISSHSTDRYYILTA
jgi:hypothetical protein